MKIEIQYTASQGPHSMDISVSDVLGLPAVDGSVTITQPTRTGQKTLTIEGTPEELAALAAVLRRAAGR